MIEKILLNTIVHAILEFLHWKSRDVYTDGKNTGIACPIWHKSDKASSINDVTQKLRCFLFLGLSIYLFKMLLYFLSINCVHKDHAFVMSLGVVWGFVTPFFELRAFLYGVKRRMGVQTKHFKTSHLHGPF